MSESIPSTKIGTSEPLNICSGIGYFPMPGIDPEGQTHRGYPTGLQPEWVLWDFRSKLLWGDNDFVTKAVARIEAGICGPNYAIKSTFQGTADNSGMTLSVASDEIAAGFFFGIGIFFTPSMSIFGASVPLPAAAVDVIDEIVKLLGMKSPQGSSFARVSEFTPSLTRTTGYSMFDANQNAFGANQGKYKATPTFNIAVDLVNRIPALWTLQENIDNVLRPIGFQFRLTFGPVLGIQLPVTVTVDSVEIDGAKYSGITYNANTQKLSSVNGPVGSLPSAPQTLRVYFKHTPSLTFSLGVSWGMGVDKVFFLGGQQSFPVGQWLGLSVDLGTWKNPLQNNWGSQTLPILGAEHAAAGSADFAESPDADFVEVIFEAADAKA